MPIHSPYLVSIFPNFIIQIFPSTILWIHFVKLSNIIYIYMIVHPRKCFKPFHPVQFVNQIGKITKNSIFWHFRLHIYTYICILTGLQVLRFLCKPSFTMFCSSLKYGEIFLQKELPKKLFIDNIFGKNLWGGVHGGRGSKMHFPIYVNQQTVSLFPNHVEIFTWEVTPWQELRKDLPLS